MPCLFLKHCINQLRDLFRIKRLENEDVRNAGMKTTPLLISLGVDNLLNNTL